MDPLTNLYERLRAQSPRGTVPPEPPSLEEWLQYWNDDDTDFGNLQNFKHWLSCNLDARNAERAFHQEADRGLVEKVLPASSPSSGEAQRIDS